MNLTPEQQENIMSVYWSKNLTLQEHHRALVASRKSDGWKLGNVKNDKTKRHPNLIDNVYKLKESQFNKYLLFRGAANSLV